MMDALKDWFHLHYQTLKDFLPPLVGLLGIFMTAGFAFAGFRTFGKWKREKIEEKRIEIALDAMTLAYEAQTVFDEIRNPGSFAHEWEGMPRWEGETDESYGYRKTYYVTLKRIHDRAEFFNNVAKLQSRFMAVFGPETEEIFKKLRMARVHVQVSAKMLMQRPDDGKYNEERARRRTRMEADIWSGIAEAYPPEELPDGDRVQRHLDIFRSGIIDRCRPIIDRNFRRTAPKKRAD